MLVLTRKKNEAIVINDVIKVTVIEIRGDKVRLGITAPVDIPVHRQEVWEQIQQESRLEDRGPDNPGRVLSGGPCPICGGVLGHDNLCLRKGE